MALNQLEAFRMFLLEIQLETSKNLQLLMIVKKVFLVLLLSQFNHHNIRARYQLVQ